MNFAVWTPRALSVLRIVTGLLFLEHRTQKLLGFPPSEHAAPALFSVFKGFSNWLVASSFSSGFLPDRWRSSSRARGWVRLYKLLAVGRQA